MAAESPFGLAASEAGTGPAELPSPSNDASATAPQNPFHAKPPQPGDSAPEMPPFEMPTAGEGGFEMKGISASDSPVGNIDIAPIGGGSAPSTPFAGGGAALSNEASNPFGAAQQAPAPSSLSDFGGMPESKATPATPAFPSPPVEAAPVAVAPAAPAPVRVSSAPVTPIDSIKQLEVRAIFGVDRELNRSELIQRAKALPGIKNLSTVSGEEVVALETVQNCMANLGFGQTETILLTCPNGVIEFVSQGMSTMAVVRDGDWKPGVRETLIIISRELDKL